MKFVTLCLATLLSASAWAQSASVDLEIKSDNIYRGESITDDDFAVAGKLRLDDFFIPGLFVEAAADSQGDNRLDSMNLRVRTGAGLAVSQRGVSLEGSVNRVFNPALQADDFVEATAAFRTDWRLLGYLDFDGSVNRAVTGVKNWYVDAGIVARDVLVDGFDLSAGIGFYQYEGSDNWDFDRNAWQFGISYELSEDVSVYAERSMGNLGFSGQPLDDYTIVGVRLGL